MRPLLPIVVCALFVAGSAAMPMTRAVAGTLAPNAMPVAAGCSLGRTRDAMGRCHHPFNRFHHHRQFKAYTRKHCTPMHTPDGTVGFCKV